MRFDRFVAPNRCCSCCRHGRLARRAAVGFAASPLGRRSRVFDRRYPTPDDKVRFKAETGMELKQIQHWFSNMRKRKYLKLGSGPGQHAPRDPFEAQLYALKERVTPVPKFASKGPAERPDVERAVDLVGRAVTDLCARPDAGRAVEVLAAAALAAADDDDDDMIAASAVSFVSPP